MSVYNEGKKKCEKCGCYFAIQDMVIDARGHHCKKCRGTIREEHR
jgi:predicted  nucleic acid-binding Zn ribbon protein